MFDLTKFAVLVFQLQARVKQLHDDPPESLEDYTALAEEIEALLAKIKGERKSPDFDTDAFKAGRADALKGYLADDSDLDHLPPVDPKPAAFPYSTTLTADPGDDSRLKNKDKVYRAEADQSKFTVASGRVGGDDITSFFPEIAGVEEPNWKIFRTVAK